MSRHSRSPSRSRSRSPAKRARSMSTDSRPSGLRDAPKEKCPFLIRLFITKGRHTPIAEFDQGRPPLRDEFQVYGWASSTPSSLIQLLLPSLPPTYRSPLARFSFKHIYVDASQRGLYRARDLCHFSGRELIARALPKPERRVDGDVAGGDRRGNGDGDKMDMELDHIPLPSTERDRDRDAEDVDEVDEKTLEAYGFITGDLLSVSVVVPEARLRRPDAPPNGAGNAGPASGPQFVSGPGPGPGAGRAFGGIGDRDRGQRGDFGWNSNGRAGPGPGPGQDERSGAWGRGAPLPPQDASARRASHGRDGPSGGGAVGAGVDAPRWGHIGERNGAAPGPGPQGRAPIISGTAYRDRDGRAPFPGRGGRSRSPDYTRGAGRAGSRERDRPRERSRSRSRSAGRSRRGDDRADEGRNGNGRDARRESWADRR